MKRSSILGLALVGLALVTPAAAQTYQECGTIVAGVTCPKLFQADSGPIYILDADLSGLDVGDRLQVMGDLDPTCFSICIQGSGCVFNTSIGPDACDPIGTPFCDPAQNNSTGVPGTMRATGSDVAADDDLTLTAEDLPNGEFAYFLCSQSQGVTPFPGGSQGILCLLGNIGRFNAQVGQVSGGSYSIVVDTTALPTNPAQPILAGETWSFQCWYRDTNPSPTSNFTHAVQITFQ